MEPSTTVGHERRKAPRTTLDKILYLNLEPDNSGIVLNLSDSGLAFHSRAPIQQSGVVRFWFSMQSDRRLEALGEVVWTDPAKKTGGLRFTNLPDGVRVQIRNLVGKLSVVADAGLKGAPPSPSLPAGREPMNHRPAPVFRGLPPQLEPPQQPQHLPLGRLPALDPSEQTPFERLHDPWAAPPSLETRPQFVRGIATGLLAAALIIGAGSLWYAYRHEVGATMVQWGERLQGNSRRTASQTPSDESGALSPAPELPATSATPVGPAEEPAASRQIPQNLPGSATKPVPESQASAPPVEDGAEADLAAARRYLNGAGRIRNSAAAAQLLWAAVEKGSSTAEVMLAGLYVRGDGVAKSCEQARVLLKAASEKGNTEAADNLVGLYKNGCR